MDEVKKRALDEQRLSLLKKDLLELRNDTYCVVDVDYDNYRITIKGLLFSLFKWNCIYIRPYVDNECLVLEY